MSVAVTEAVAEEDAALGKVLQHAMVMPGGGPDLVPALAALTLPGQVALVHGLTLGRRPDPTLPILRGAGAALGLGLVVVGAAGVLEVAGVGMTSGIAGPEAVLLQKRRPTRSDCLTLLKFLVKSSMHLVYYAV